MAARHAVPVTCATSMAVVVSVIFYRTKKNSNNKLASFFVAYKCVSLDAFTKSQKHVEVLMKQKRNTEGCSKLKSPETRQVLERLVLTLEHMQVPKWDRTRCPEE